jgi:hypothetical protein
VDLIDVVKEAVFRSPDDRLQVFLDVPAGPPEGEQSTLVAYPVSGVWPNDRSGIVIAQCKLRIRFVTGDGLMATTPIGSWFVVDPPNNFTGSLSDLSFAQVVAVMWGDGEQDDYTPPFDSVSHTYAEPGDYVIDAFVRIEGGQPRLGNDFGDTHPFHAE